MWDLAAGAERVVGLERSVLLGETSSTSTAHVRALRRYAFFVFREGEKNTGDFRVSLVVLETNTPGVVARCQLISSEMGPLRARGRSD